MSLKSDPPAGTVRVDDYVKGELSKDTNWWGAFVVGLAGTILVTGVTPAVLGPLGAAAIPNFVFWALTGWLLCLFLAELAAMLPDATVTELEGEGHMIAVSRRVEIVRALL